MTSTILEKIFNDKRVRVDAAKRSVDAVDLLENALESRSARAPHRLIEALFDRSSINIIVEFKKASPSRGVINDGVDPAEIAREYERGGAAAMSVLTEEDHFKGSLDDLAARLADLKYRIDVNAADMTAHGDFIRSYCPAPALEPAA